MTALKSACVAFHPTAEASGLSRSHPGFVKLDHVLPLDSLPLIHKDPFDRLLVAQANVENAALVSGDPIVAQYPVNVTW